MNQLLTELSWALPLSTLPFIMAYLIPRYVNSRRERNNIMTKGKL